MNKYYCTFLFLFYIGCVINKILSFYNNGPCRISRFSIVAAVSDLKKNLDSNERDTINGKKFDDCEKICTKSNIENFKML